MMTGTLARCTTGSTVDGERVGGDMEEDQVHVRLAELVSGFQGCLGLSIKPRFTTSTPERTSLFSTT